MKLKQLIFIDDSGDSGFKFRKGSSSLFVMACVIFESQYEAEYTSAAIRLLKEKNGWHQYREYKFNKTNDEQRKVFLSEMKKYNFKIRAIVVDKKNIETPVVKGMDNFYNVIVLKVLERFDGMKEATIKLDGSGDRSFKRKLSSSIRKKLNKNGIRKVVDFSLEDSQDNVLIQLAYMIAGAIRIKYDKNRVTKTNYLRPITSKIDDIWIFEK